MNPILYSYYNVKIAAWNDLAIGAAVVLLVVCQDLEGSPSSEMAQRPSWAF
jgi:hypothetical protein